MKGPRQIKQTPKATDQQIVDTMSGKICRLGTYQRFGAGDQIAAEAAVRT